MNFFDLFDGRFAHLKDEIRKHCDPTLAMLLASDVPEDLQDLVSVILRAVPDAEIGLASDVAIAATKHLSVAWKGFLGEMGPRLTQIMSLGEQMKKTPIAALTAASTGAQAAARESYQPSIDPAAAPLVEWVRGVTGTTADRVFGKWENPETCLSAGVLRPAQVKIIASIIDGKSAIAEIDRLAVGAERVLAAQRIAIAAMTGSRTNALFDLIDKRRPEAEAARNARMTQGGGEAA